MTDMPRILVVDDEEDIRAGVSRWLSAKGFDVMHAGDGVEAIDAAFEQHPDAILMDVLMPRKDGLAALAELRADERTCSTPVVMLSASLRDEQRALDAGATYFVPKPYCGKQLITAVEVAMDDARQAVSTTSND